MTLVSFRNADRKLCTPSNRSRAPGRVLYLAHHLGLPVLRARFDLAQFHEATIEQQQVGGQRGVGELRVLDAAGRGDTQVHKGAGFEHGVVQT